MKRLVFSLFILISAVLTVSCGGDTPERSKHFRASEIAIPDGYELMNGKLDCAGGKVTVKLATEYDPNAAAQNQELFLLDIDLATGEQSLTSESEGSGERELWRSGTGSGGDFTVTGVLGDMAYASMTLTETDRHGKTVNTLDCGELFEAELSRFKANMAGEGIFNFCGAFEHEDGLLAVSSVGVAYLPESGVKRLYTSKSEIRSAAYVNGRLILIMGSIGSLRPYYFDLAAFDKGEELKLPEGVAGTDFFALDGYELALLNSDGVFGFNRGEDGELAGELLYNLTEAGFGADIRRLKPISPDEYLLIYYDRVRNANSLWRLEAIPLDEYTPRTELTLAAIPVDQISLMREAVDEFNRTNDKYYFTVKVYNGEDEKGALSGIDGAKLRFAADLTSGDIPDVVMIYDGLGVDSDIYEAQGLFCDLYAVMDEAGYDRSNILPCQTESFARQNPRTGQVYLPYLAIDAQIVTMISDSEVFEGRTTLERLLDLTDKGIKPVKNYNSYQLFNRYLRCDLERFIDSDGSGTELVPSVVFAITESCEHKSAAWEFFEVLMSDDYCDIDAKSRLPLTTASSFEKAIENYPRYYYFADKYTAVSSTPFTEERLEVISNGAVTGTVIELDKGLIDKLREIVLSARAVPPMTDKIISIINEEIEAAHLSPAEIAHIINDRVELAYNE